MHRCSTTFAALALAVSGRAGAISITAAASGTVNEVTRSDVAGPAPSGALLADESFDIDAFFPPMTTRAAVNDAGDAAVELRGNYWHSSKPHRTAGGSTLHVLDAQSTWSSTVTNDNLSPKAYRYTFHINPIQLQISDFSGTVNDGNEDAPRALYRVEVTRDAGIVFMSQAELFGGGGGHALQETGTDFGGVLTQDEVVKTYDFSEYNGVVGLGVLQPMQSMTVTARLIAHTSVEIENTGSTVSMGDPLDLKDDPGVDSNIIEIDETVGVESVPWAAVKALYRR